MSEDVVADGTDIGSGDVPAEPEGDASSGGASFEDETVDILEVRELVADVAETLLGDPFDGITTVEQSEDGGWRAVFEVVERNAVPDTQDIIGRYELFISEAGDVQEYSLQQRFKRGEMEGESL